MHAPAKKLIAGAGVGSERDPNVRAPQLCHDPFKLFESLAGTRNGLWRSLTPLSRSAV